jgi:hypothetical protein
MKLIAQSPGLISDDVNQRRPAPFDERRLQGLRQAAPLVFLHDQAVHHHVDLRQPREV